jgi:hypothetical protein
VWWSIHVWLGAPVMASLAGVLVTFLVWPVEQRNR